MYTRFGKRALDIIVSIVAGVVLFIPMLVIALLIRLESKGPAIFKQKRFGRDRKQFIIYKFRSMKTSAPKNKATSQFHNSQAYITRVGRVIRKLSLDELPQLINIIRGDMSFIGPRPLVLSEKSVIDLRERVNANHIRPGISGWAQANGRDKMDDITKADFDGYYAQHLGLKIDIKCFLKTVLIVATAYGHVEGHESTKEDEEMGTTGE